MSYGVINLSLKCLESGQKGVMVWGCFIKNKLSLLVKLESRIMAKENSPDLNPIENFWDELDRKIRKYKPLSKNWNELWQILQEEWLNFDEKIYKNLVNSMPQRIAAVISNKVERELSQFKNSFNIAKCPVTNDTPLYYSNKIEIKNNSYSKIINYVPWMLSDSLGDLNVTGLLGRTGLGM
ncbi:hypothetical protein C1645_832760 [Glomus cerebriforme]|uniref:Tc1-like transposase DDE domain-containing protein n=1 Tax=Glomus cerebriforme TaxID=658196 RepID=A0A397SMP1_9GLOM|nr:hypothetical protein C1645_832760 [Glomus cerebriforme]